MLPLRLLSEGEKLLDPIPLLNPPPSQREGGGKRGPSSYHKSRRRRYYRIPSPSCILPLPLGGGGTERNFLPLLWRGRTKEGEGRPRRKIY